MNLHGEHPNQIGEQKMFNGLSYFLAIIAQYDKERELRGY